MTAPTIAPGVCPACGTVASQPHRCEDFPSPIDVEQIPCPCCGEDTWCPEEMGQVYAELARTPVLGGPLATGGGWTR